MTAVDAGGTPAGSGPVPLMVHVAVQPPADRPAYLLCFLGVVVTNMFSGHSGELGLPIGLDRVLLFAGLLLLLLDPKACSARLLRVQAVHLIMGLLVLLAALSAAAHGNLTSSYGFFALLDRLAVPFLVFFLAPVVFSTAARRALLLKVLILIGLYLSLTAVVEITGPSLLLFPAYIGDPGVGIHFGRARGPFTEAVANGTVLTIAGFAASVGLRLLPRSWRPVCWLVLPLCALAVLLTLTRSVWLGAAVGTLLVALRTPGLRRYLPALALVGTLGVVGVFTLVPAVQKAAVERAGDQRSLWDRQNSNAAAVRAVLANPVTGIGWAQFLQDGSSYVRQDPDYPVTASTLEVHNVVLSRAAELGFPGALLWVLAVVFGPIRAALARARGDLGPWRDVLLGGGACWLVTVMFSPVPYPLPNLLVFLLAGMILQTRSREHVLQHAEAHYLREVRP